MKRPASSSDPPGIYAMLRLNPDCSRSAWLRLSRPSTAQSVEIPARFARILLVLAEARKRGRHDTAAERGWLDHKTIGKRVDPLPGATGVISVGTVSTYMTGLLNAFAKEYGDFELIERNPKHGVRLKVDLVVTVGAAGENSSTDDDDSAGAMAADL